ncbi:MAG: hypothetical protein WA269_01820 [Candidatus Udaeobacter sp.]
MRIAITLAVTLITTASAMADAVSVTSPNHARTYAYGAVTWHQLYLERTRGELAARITFSNYPFADANEPRTDQPFDFQFPGIHVDFAQHAFVATGRRGESIPVAWFRGDPSCGWIKLAPNAKIYLLKESGRVTATVTATSYPRDGERWIELNNNYSLQNLLCALFREVRLGPGG